MAEIILNPAAVAQWSIAAIALVALVCLAFSLRGAKRKLLIDNLPTSKTSGVFIGLVELKGRADTETPLSSFLAHSRCVYYRYTVEEKWERTVTETYTDKDGNAQTRQKTESGWTTVAQGGSDDAPFHLKDDRGVIRILPKGADVEPQKVFDRTCHSSDPIYFAKGPPNSISDSAHTRRFREEAIPMNAPLFVVGHARQRPDIVAAEIAAHDAAPLFLISTREEQKVSRGYRWQFWGLAVLGLVLVAAGLAWREQTLHDQYPPFSAYSRAAVIYLGAWLLGWVWMAFNSFVDLRQRVSQGWANIDVELKRRADLIPNLVKAVAGFRDHEARVQAQLAALRAQATATAPGTPGPDPAAVAGPLRAIAEAYPDLKANALFQKLQQQLGQTEERIALARSYFNDIATFYNTRLGTFPDGLVAMIGGMRRRPLMEAAGFERAPVQLKAAALSGKTGATPA